MKKCFSMAGAVFVLAILTMGVAAQDQSSQQEKASRARVLQLLEDSGHNYTKASDDVWTVAFAGNHIKEFNVVAVLEQHLLVLVVIVANKEDFKPTPEMWHKLLRLNDEFDRVKIGISDNGNLFVRTDLSLRILDGTEVKENLDQIAAAADETYLAIKGFLTSGK